MEIPLGRMNPRVEDVNSIEAQAFKVCNTDGEEGLTWLEVEACEVCAKSFSWILLCLQNQLSDSHKFLRFFFSSKAEIEIYLYPMR